MNKDKTIGQIQETTEYDKFKRLEGNRAVIELRVKKITESIKRVGYIGSPIVVNERFEVVDGQGRLEACKRLGIPIRYTVIEGIGIEECISMNINQTNWKLTDYIESYAELGNVSYMYLLNLVKAYGSIFQNKVIFSVVTGSFENATNRIKIGKLVCTATDYSRAQNILSWLTNFVPIFKNVKGHNEFYYYALTFCFEDAEVDNERLLLKIDQMQANLIPVTTTLQAFDVIEEIYNNRIRKRIYIKTNYRKAMDDRFSWYSKKWGHNYDGDKQ